jgi:hypothetical protein
MDSLRLKRNPGERESISENSRISTLLIVQKQTIAKKCFWNEDCLLKYNKPHRKTTNKEHNSIISSMNFYRLNKLSTGYDTKVPKVKMVLLQDSL